MKLSVAEWAGWPRLFKGHTIFPSVNETKIVAIVPLYQIRTRATKVV